MSAAAEKRAVLILLVFSFALFTYFSLCTPLFEASDELWHYPLVQHLATTANLPVQTADGNDDTAPWRQEGSQPPLYYAVTALVTSPIDSSNWREIRRLNLHADMGRPTSDGNANAVLHTSAENFPWTRAALAVRIARLVSILFSTLTILFTYVIAAELFARSSDEPSSTPWLRLGTMFFTACVPMFAFISGSVNNDNAAVMFATLGLWLALRMTRRGDLSLRTALICGVVVAAAALSKSSTLGLLGVFALTAVFAGLKQITSGRTTGFTQTALAVLRFFTIVVLVVAVLAGWWFYRNQQLYGDLLGWNAFLDAVGRRVPPASLQQLWSERQGFTWAYWGVFGTLNVIMPPIIYDALNSIVFVALLGVIYAVIKKATQKPALVSTEALCGKSMRTVLTLAAPTIVCAIWLVVTFVAFLRWTSLTPASQGRLLFPTIAVISATIVFGLYSLHRYVLYVVALFMLVLALYVPVAVIAPVYARPPNLKQINPQVNLDVTYNNTLSLTGFDVPSPEVSAGEYASLTVYWHTTGLLDKNYSVFVHLINDDDVIVAQRDMYPGQGTLATSELQAGYTWSEHYSLRISRLTPTPQRLRWAIGVYDLVTGERLIPAGIKSTDQGVVIDASTVVDPSPTKSSLVEYSNGISLKEYSAITDGLLPGKSLTITAQWQTTRDITQDYSVSLQLLDEHANKIAQHDGAPHDGNAPTHTWKPGDTIEDQHVLEIAPDAKPGVYRLILVIYSPTDFKQLGAYDDRGQYLGTEIELTRLRVR